MEEGVREEEMGEQKWYYQQQNFVCNDFLAIFHLPTLLITVFKIFSSSRQILDLDPFFFNF